ncbi:succinate semialdehyde dehydrogenase NADP+ linked [Elasticomyces elasticus]|uniref:Succinate-semialdehyde dehydrogenase, mitochondrial n=1 Tax=Exophiala sideris TaxID=1016849 RepID=A0ABR0JCT3_9EURO|nr:succinate semialdehyde dehydrogenase NADP+ linked [Elasticomyces elasticus]KAK5031976.1 succinate semialdehyde dehydrogenase NADP+ linked [Exophiala sideris]KAK5040905.1 succinate semialdehyde dehydrogenase NADP+ linked [Exophiala sideris]KAK5061761.1 succinate semialdehyde dehydrogenase NADP+ linked [Exophiala sideris]KAK5184461.1 succinate semialdehyde dehydrogenase NADP+ linked [Eurotiomycetes sp. CCFEE 6388]
MASSYLPQLRDDSLLKDRAFVDGEWVTDRSGKTFVVTDPVTDETIGTCPDFDSQDTEKAIEAAAVAFKHFRKTTARHRSELLRKWHQLVLENAEDLANLITWENGKPLADARGEVKYASDFILWFSEEAPRTYGSTIPASVGGRRVLTIKEPVGVCGLITPWNFPAAMITRKAAPAIAAGCTVVVKAPGETPLTSLALAELAKRAGIPSGVFNVITTLEHTPDVGKMLCAHPKVQKISFTGSTAVGKLLMKQSADSLKKLSMELGGNSPFIVFDDADLDAAVEGALASKFRSSGQTCVCTNRIYVQSPVYQSFAERFIERVKQYQVGPGFDPTTTHGPLIHSRAVEKVESHVRDAEVKGARIALGGSPLTENVKSGNFYQLTVLLDATKDMRISNEETFGPVAALFQFETEQEVINLANDSQVGLAGYFFSRDIARCWRVAEAMEVGMVGINTGK